MELLRDLRLRPGRLGHRRDLLERDAGEAAGSRVNDEPVAAALVVAAGSGRLIARPVGEAEQLAVELRQPPGVGRVEHHLPPARERLADAHETTFRSAGTNGPFGRIDYRTAPLSDIFGPFRGEPLISLLIDRKAL